MRKEIIHRINQLGKEGKPFLFVIDYLGNQAFIEPLADINPEICLYDFEGMNNLTDNPSQEIASPLSSPITWRMDAAPLRGLQAQLRYRKAQHHAGKQLSHQSHL